MVRLVVKKLLVKLAFHNLRSHKFRSILTIIGLAIAGLGIAGFIIASTSIITSAQKSFGMVNSPTAIIYVRDAEWNQTLVSGLNLQYDLQYRIMTTAIINGQIQRITIHGINVSKIATDESLLPIIIDEGTLPNDSEGLIENAASKALGIQKETILSFNLPNQEGSLVNTSIKITGFATNVNDLGYTFSSAIDIWVSLNYIHKLLKRKLFTTLYIKSENSTITEIVNRMDKNDIFVEHVEYPENQEDPRKEILDVLQVLTLITSGIGILIGGILCSSTINMAIAAERKNIALLKIIGGRQHQLFYAYLLEAFLLGFFGSIIGVGVAIASGAFILKQFAEPFNLPVVELVVPINAIVIGMAVPILTSLIFPIPALVGVLKVKPLQFFKKDSMVSQFLHKVPKDSIIGFSIGNLARNRKRMALNILMVALAVSLVVSVQSLSDSYTYEIDQFLDSFPADIIITSSVMQNKTIMEDIISEYFSQNHPSMLQSFTTLWWAQVDVVVGNTTVTVNFLGVNTSSNQFKPIFPEGAFAENNSIVVTSLFNRDYLGNQNPVGKNLTLKTYTKSKSFIIGGVINDKNNGGKMVYAPLEQVQDFLEGNGLVNVAYISLKDPSQGYKIGLEMSEDPKIQAYGWTITSMEYWREFNLRQATYFSFFITMISSVGIVVAIIGGINTFTLNNLQREQEFAILKMIGAKPRWIFFSLIIEATIASFFATLVAIPLARYVIIANTVDFITRKIIPMKLIFSTKHVLSSVAISVFSILSSAIIPAFKSARTNTIEGIKYE